jgi:hypothetical protein
MSQNQPPPNVAAAALVVETWLREQDQQTLPRSPEEIAKMSARERIDYCRQFDQSKMPAWRSPRAG